MIATELDHARSGAAAPPHYPLSTRNSQRTKRIQYLMIHTRSQTLSITLFL